MYKLRKILVSVVLVTLIALLFTGCGGRSVVGRYYRDFGGHTSTTMFIELKRDNTFITDGSDPNLLTEGTYEIDGSVITFTFTNTVILEMFNLDDTVVGTIADGAITVGRVTYRR
ncbi:MAG: hypothetical protein FWC75_08415 [Oscillospiraceae bacterium]|nr:hypothetical protein [Oscillospiraceae bacterium]